MKICFLKLIYAWKHMVWVFEGSSPWEHSFEFPKQVLKLVDGRISPFLSKGGWVIEIKLSYLFYWKHAVDPEKSRLSETVLSSTLNKCWNWLMGHFFHFSKINFLIYEWKHVMYAHESRRIGDIWTPMTKVKIDGFENFSNFTLIIWSFTVLIKWCDIKTLCA